MRVPRDEIPPGTLEMLILRVLIGGGPLHSFAIADETRQRFEDVEEGSLYLALQRMRMEAWIEGDRGRTPENRCARYYRPTAGGRQQCQRETEPYDRVSQAIARVLCPV